MVYLDRNHIQNQNSPNARSRFFVSIFSIIRFPHPRASCTTTFLKRPIFKLLVGEVLWLQIYESHIAIFELQNFEEENSREENPGFIILHTHLYLHMSRKICQLFPYTHKHYTKELETKSTREKKEEAWRVPLLVTFVCLFVSSTVLILLATKKSVFISRPVITHKTKKLLFDYSNRTAYHPLLTCTRWQQSFSGSWSCSIARLSIAGVGRWLRRASSLGHGGSSCPTVLSAGHWHGVWWVTSGILMLLASVFRRPSGRRRSARIDWAHQDRWILRDRILD